VLQLEQYDMCVAS